MIHRYLIEPRDPALFRDGKPFSAGLSASSLLFPFPSTVAGMIRTLAGGPSDYADLSQLRAISQTGPFLVYSSDVHSTDDGISWQYAFPAPADAVAYNGADGLLDIERIEPGLLQQDEGMYDCKDVEQIVFPASGKKTSTRLPHFWSWSFYETWLADPKNCSEQLTEVGPPPFARQKRMHVAISPGTGTAKDGMLFATDSVEFLAVNKDTRQVTSFALVTQTYIPDSFPPLPKLANLGGERRIALLSNQSAPVLPKAPAALAGIGRIRIILATPGAFSTGWRPRWLTNSWSPVPYHAGLELKLVAAAVPRPLPISGWSLERGQNEPKATRLLAPAGSVYFCEVKGDASTLWLTSICEGQDATDGFGIVTLGVW